MQETSPTFQTVLDAHELNAGSFDFVELIEIYAHDYLPGAGGFDPAAAEERFGGVEGFTFLGLAYQREYVGRNEVQRLFGKQENNVNADFSNVSRVLAAYVQSNDVSGKWLVVRTLSPLSSTVLADSIVLFCGRLEKPGDLGDTNGSLPAKQSFGPVNLQFPPRTFSPNDKLNRDPADPKFEGFRFTPMQATVLWTTRERRPGFGGLIGLTKKIRHSLQASSQSDVAADMAVPDAFGRVQMYVFHLAALDIGGAINLSVAVCEGVIAEYVSIRQTNPKFSQISANPARFYGYVGNEGPPGREQKPIRVLAPAIPNHPGDGHYSRTAWFAGFVSGSTHDVDEADAPDWIVLIKAKIVKVPDGSGEWTVEEWSDNPVDIARFLLAEERYFNEGENALEDAVNLQTRQHCEEFVLDATQGERAFVPSADISQVSRVGSTGLVTPRSIRIGEIGDLAGDAGAVPIIPETFDPGDPPGTNPPVLPGRPRLEAPFAYLRRRYTCNVTLTERQTAVDFLHNVIAPTGRLYFVRNGKGRIEIRGEKPADNTRLRAGAVATDTAVKVLDVEPWKAGLLLKQKLLVGAHLTTSEVRAVTAASYTADGNLITLSTSVSGGVTATASGATLAGGSSSTPASATVTIGGSPAAGDSVAITIDGVSAVYVLDGDASEEATAAMLARLIEATPALRQFVKATWGGANVLTIQARYGVLTLNSPLVNPHTGPVANPAAAPTLTAGPGGVLDAGPWLVAYSYATASGESFISPAGVATVSASGKITTGAVTLPAGAASLNWYVSKYVGSSELVYYGSNNGSAYTIGLTDAPDSSEALPPDINTTGEELVRVAMSFAANDQGAAILAQAGLTRGNVHAGTAKWPLGGKQSAANVFRGTFFNAVDDYASTPIEVRDFAHIARTRKESKMEADLSGFDSHSQASRYLNFLSAKYRDGDFFVEFSTGPAAILLEEGDVICVSFDNGGFVNLPVRVEELRIGPAPTYTCRIVARKYATSMFSDNVRQTAVKLPTVLRTVTPIPTSAVLIDLTAVSEEDGSRPGFYVVPTFDASAHGSWKGFSLWADYGAGYQKLAEGDVAGTTGTATTHLSAGSPHQPETGTTLTVVVEPGRSLSSVTLTQAYASARANLAAYGAEYVQFLTATLTDEATNTWTLTGFLRGRFGTATDAHADGESFALMEAAVFVPAPLSALNVSFPYKALTVNQSLSDVTPQNFTWTGGSVKPLAPVNAHRRDDSDGNSLIEWTPRRRLGHGIHQGMSGFDDLSPEHFLVEFTDSSFNPLPDPLEMPVITNLALAALFESSSPDKFDGVDINTLSMDNNTDGVVLSARSLQRIRQTGNFAAATLRAGDGLVGFGFIRDSADWRSGAAPETLCDYWVQLSVGPDELRVFVEGVEVYSEDASSYVSTGVRVDAVLSGAECRFVKDRKGDSTPPFYVSPLKPNPPYHVFARCDRTGFTGFGSIDLAVEKVTMKTTPDPKTILTSAQKAKYGIGPTVYCKITQVDARVGKGYALRVALEDEL